LAYLSGMTEDATITCPKCGADIPLTEAVSHRLREQLEFEFNQKRDSLNAALAERERKLAEQKAALEASARDLQSRVEEQLAAERAKLIAQAEEKAAEQLALQLQDLQEQLAEQNRQLQAARQTELDLRKQQRQLEEARAALELEVARKLDAERQKIANTARQQAAEAERLKLADKDHLIDSLKKQIDELRQKAEQGSMQAQGETLELELEQQLRDTFADDQITEIKKGQRGADVLQRVRTNAGLDCGAILWEAKRARNWSPQWTAKLKEDRAAAGAELAVIVTTCPPEGLRGVGQRDRIWVCEPAFAPVLAAALRDGLIRAALQRSHETDRADKTAQLYDYLCGAEFRQHIEGIVEAFLGLKDQLESEQRAFARQWKERDKQLNRAINHTATLYGGIQGIAGRNALPSIRTLELPG